MYHVVGQIHLGLEDYERDNGEVSITLFCILIEKRRELKYPLDEKMG